METLVFPKDFLFGTATAALQIEGGDTNNNWYQWAQQGHIKDHSSPLRANEHWKRFKEDIQLLAELGVHTHRLGLEWSRIEPKPGTFSQEGIEHYLEEISLLRKHTIRPLVTLYHFSHPLWFEEKGGWENEESIQDFLRYVRFVVEKLGHLVSDWVTINEPNVFLSYGYVLGTWPPGKQDSQAMIRAARHLVLAHLQAYTLIHELRKKEKEPTLVGVAHHLRVFSPFCQFCPLDHLASLLNDYIFQGIFLEGMGRGRFLPPLGVGYPMGKGRFQDFVGINYYSRDKIQFVWNPPELFAKRLVAKNAPTNNLGWEIYPKGLSLLAKRLWKTYRLPLFITENGTCDKEDAFRPQFIYDHLKEVSELIAQGIPVKRYYHWTFIDNFEWIEGESAPFGLFANNYDTQTRTWRNSARFYQEICRTRTITQEMLSRYVQSAYHSLS
ncbi:MAG: glycoside hydrolase family 1 protein [Brevinematales bacterium]|nr:glycoside hydrolase family 1 protein [Brevinematales bacterium]